MRSLLFYPVEFVFAIGFPRRGPPKLHRLAKAIHILLYGLPTIGNCMVLSFQNFACDRTLHVRSLTVLILYPICFCVIQYPASFVRRSHLFGLGSIWLELRISVMDICHTSSECIFSIALQCGGHATRCQYTGLENRDNRSLNSQIDSLRIIQRKDKLKKESS
jgi:hypothetical protein